MKISKELATAIIKGLYIPAGESGYIHFPHSKMLYTWEYEDYSNEYTIYAARRNQVIKYGYPAPVRENRYDSMLLDFSNTYIDVWVPVASFTGKELFPSVWHWRN